MNRLTRRFAAAGGIALVAIAALVVPSAASAATAGAPTGRYAAQATRAHLTAQQVATLQHAVDSLVAKTGGTQTAINKISLPGADILVPVPGEARARDLSQVVSPAAAGCPYEYFCVYQLTGFAGTQYNLYFCQDYNMPWFGNGSYDNNETPGTIATFKNVNHTVIESSFPPDHPGVSPFNWSPVYFVRPC